MNTISCFAQNTRYMNLESVLTWNRLFRDVAERKPLCLEVPSDTVALQAGGVCCRRDGEHHGNNPQYHGTRHFRWSFTERAKKTQKTAVRKHTRPILDTVHDVLCLSLPAAGRTWRCSRSYIRIRIRARFVLAYKTVLLLFRFNEPAFRKVPNWETKTTARTILPASPNARNTLIRDWSIEWNVRRESARLRATLCELSGNVHARTGLPAILRNLQLLVKSNKTRELLLFRWFPKK